MGRRDATGGLFLGIEDGIVEGNLLVTGGGESRMVDAE